ncbi:superoxide dismutase family protein [Candidatus Poribacteria bacterium]|nr:superoxide dismutase family protein [Candidatus Poribacteria bacterium]MYA58331.1 superoxide dismutase family protein [Candidatus Poribacteria bacterium]
MDFKRHTYKIIITLIIAACLVIGCEKIPTQMTPTESIDKVAVATISEIEGSGLTGTATFTEMDAEVHVVIEIQGATSGLHAIHLHTGSSCADIGPHWHPMGIPAGTSGIPVVQATLDTPPIGVGEVGNITVGKDGTGILEFMTPFWSLGRDPNTDILGKLIMIHETGDTFLTHPHAHPMNMQTDMNMETVQPHFHPPGTPAHAHANAQTTIPTILPGGGAKIGCGLIELTK